MANTAGLAKMTFTITEIYKRSVTSNSTGKEKALSKKKKKKEAQKYHLYKPSIALERFSQLHRNGWHSLS